MMKETREGERERGGKRSHIHYKPDENPQGNTTLMTTTTIRLSCVFANDWRRQQNTVDCHCLRFVSFSFSFSRHVSINTCMHQKQQHTYSHTHTRHCERTEKIVEMKNIRKYRLRHSGILLLFSISAPEQHSLFLLCAAVVCVCVCLCRMLVDVWCTRTVVVVVIVCHQQGRNKFDSMKFVTNIRNRRRTVACNNESRTRN